MSAISAELDGFPTMGKFFYTQVYYDPDDTQHYYINMKLGCDGWKQKWLITTQEESVGYVTSICAQNRKCDVPDKFPWNDFENNPADPCLKDDKFTQEMIFETARLNSGQNSAFTRPISDFVL